MFCNRLHKFLLPMLGEAPAKRLILMYCSNNNISPHDLTEKDLPQVGMFLAENIRAFVGADKAQTIVKALTKAA